MAKDLKSARLSALLGCYVQLCFQGNNVTGFILGHLSQDGCSHDDFIVMNDGSRIIFNKTAFDRINDSDPNIPPLVFVNCTKEDKGEHDQNGI